MADASKRVLVVDDEKDICGLLQVKFERAGFQVETAFDGLDASSKILSFLPDCILLDICMPREDGLTFLRKLRAYRHDDPELQSYVRKIPVVILTAASFHMKALFLNEGISDYVEKPFDFEVLKEKVSSLIFARTEKSRGL